MKNFQEYSQKFKEKCWAMNYHVYAFLIANGEVLAFETYPAPVVNFFKNWINARKKVETKLLKNQDLRKKGGIFKYN